VSCTAGAAFRKAITKQFKVKFVSLTTKAAEYEVSPKAGLIVHSEQGFQICQPPITSLTQVTGFLWVA